MKSARLDMPVELPFAYFQCSKLDVQFPHGALCRLRPWWANPENPRASRSLGSAAQPATAGRSQKRSMKNHGARQDVHFRGHPSDYPAGLFKGKQEMCSNHWKMVPLMESKKPCPPSGSVRSALKGPLILVTCCPNHGLQWFKGQRAW